MSMIQKEVRDFQVQAYQNGAFQTISEADVVGKWGIFFYLLISLLSARPS